MVWSVFYLFYTNAFQNKPVTVEAMQVVCRNAFMYDVFFYTYMTLCGTATTANWYYLPLILILHDMFYFIMRKIVGKHTESRHGAFYAWHMPHRDFLLVEVLPWYLVTWYFPVGFKTYLSLHLFNIVRIAAKPTEYTSPYDLLAYVF